MYYISINSVSLLLVLAAIFTYLNYKFFKLTFSIALLLMSLALSLLVISISYVFPESKDWLIELIGELNFKDFLLNGILGALLFAGALHMNEVLLWKMRYHVLVYAFAVTTITIVVYSLLLYLILNTFGLHLTLLHAFLIGSILSPTDPAATVNILKEVKANKKLETIIAGESLFNDSVAVVFFLMFFNLSLAGKESFHLSEAIIIFIRQALGGTALGFLLGWLGKKLLATIHSREIAVIVALGIAIGGFSVANILGTSGPMAMAVSGLIIGSKNLGKKMDNNRDRPQMTSDNFFLWFWSMIDQLLSSMLYVAIGLLILLIPDLVKNMLIGVLSALVLVVARLVAVIVPVFSMEKNKGHILDNLTLLVWGGLKGGVCIAMGIKLFLNFPDLSRAGYAIYFTVLFSIIVQGLSMKWLVSKLKLT